MDGNYGGGGKDNISLGVPAQGGYWMKNSDMEKGFQQVLINV